jgi:hypothetical protein
MLIRQDSTAVIELIRGRWVRAISSGISLTARWPRSAAQRATGGARRQRESGNHADARSQKNVRRWSADNPYLHFIRTEFGTATVLVRAKTTPGVIHSKAQVQGLKSGEARIVSTPPLLPLDFDAQYAAASKPAAKW